MCIKRPGKAAYHHSLMNIDAISFISTSIASYFESHCYQRISVCNMALKHQICACFVQQTSFYVQAAEPSSYKCLDVIERSSDSLIKDISVLAKHIPSKDHATQKRHFKYAPQCFSKCTIPTTDDTLITFIPQADCDSDTAMDTSFTQNDDDLLEAMSHLDATLDTAFSENFDTSVETDGSVNNTATTCSSNDHLVVNKHQTKKQRPSISKTFIKKIAKHFH